MGRSLLIHVLIFGLLGGVVIAALKWLEYRWLIVSHSAEVYGAAVAVLFAALGLLLGQRLTRPTVVLREVPVPIAAAPSEFERDLAKQTELGLTAREIEVLEELAAGHSNREIAARGFVSENTVKTHISRIYDKLGAKRRTQAVQRARELRLIR
jgi:ATP/maltotriose-dependent transcriptional regulator MalT